MKHVTKSFLGMALASLVFVGAGCVSVSSGGASQQGADGGVFRSTNKGDNWAQKIAVATAGAPKNIAGVNVITLVQDPSDPAALYIGTAESGMYYSYDGGESWQQSPQVSRGRVPSIAVNPKDKCMVYIAIENKLLKTEDCSRSWVVTYLDARADKLTTAVAVEANDTRTVWIGNSAGDLLRSKDGGASWTVVKSLGNHISKIALNTADSKRMFIATRTAGVWRTPDAGANWINLLDRYKEHSGANEFFDIALGVSDPALIVLATKHGLIRSTDGGERFESIPLLTAPGSSVIYSVAVDPKDSSSIYYGTSTLFYRSPNGGANWTTIRLPSSRTATVLHVDRANSGSILLGVTRFK
jgi:photosystem II stability/assembly factor-like uncharacterized protein